MMGSFTPRKFMLFVFLFIWIKTSFAQIEKGTFTVGNSFFIQANDKDQSTNLYLQLNTGMSYFLARNLAVGLNYNWTKVKAREYASEYHDIDGNGAGLYARYYVFLKKASAEKNIRFAFFIQAGANILFSDHHFHRDAEDPNQFEQTFKQFTIHPGLAMMVGKRWSFECTFRGITYEQYKIKDFDRSWDFFGLGMNSIQNNQNYFYMDINNPAFMFMGGVRYHF